ncbi:low temperature requirement protein A [Micromonospora sp. U56]|uniref:low temperature requirement protein A n=1 Tax=Micromonospora sp. U56 TaxID=2824900 RepID=UPI001B378EC8|nr:low temperature requirement protein A [Micromonospora sp. U56]MBQ0897420.1 low temperature requirement protein A [Micromonospora sp. U56]
MGEPGGERLMREKAGWRRATILELLFDLVFVFALNQLSLRLIHDLNAGSQQWFGEVVQTFLLFLAFWVLWLSTVAVTSRQSPESPVIQAVVFMSMAGAVVMSVAVPQGFEQRALLFAGAYVATRISRVPLLLVFRLPVVSTPALLPLAVSAVLWIVGALVHNEGLRAVLWTLALVIGYIGFTRHFQRLAGAPIAGEHLAERLQQFYLITLGEAGFVSGKAFSGSNLGTPHAAGFGLAFVAIVLLWRVYFYRAGTVLPVAITGARNPARQSVAVAGTHLLMIAGVLLAGVGFELYIMEPLGRPEPKWLIAILGGPALFLAGRSLFELQVFSRISRSRLAGLLALSLLIPATWYLPPLAAGGAAVTVLAAIAGSDAWRARGRAPEAPTPLI